MLLLKKDTFSVESDSPRVTADDGAVLARAEEIVAAAQAEAARIREDAVKTYESEKARGYADGIAEGKKEILLQKLDLIDESVKYMSSVESTVCDIVLKALRKCIMEIGDRELVVQIVRKSMQAVVRTQKELVVRVSNDMVQTVRERMSALLADFPTVARIDVVGDERLAATACVVETDVGIVEASVDGQLEAIEQSIRKSFEER